MAHPEQKAFCEYVKKKCPDFFKGKKVLDVGSEDINGNNKYLFEDCEYFGCDVVEAENVTHVSFCHELPFKDETFDVIVSTECFEHDMFWTASLRKIFKMLKIGGLFFFSCATTGREEHGTSRTRPGSSGTTRLGIEYYGNRTAEDIDMVLHVSDNFENPEFRLNPYAGRGQMEDLYFSGIKKTKKVYKNKEMLVE